MISTRLAPATRFATPAHIRPGRVNSLASVNEPARFYAWLLAVCVACLMPFIGASVALAGGVADAPVPTAQAERCNVPVSASESNSDEGACDACPPETGSDAEGTSEDEESSPEISDDHIAAHHDGSAWFSSGSRIPLVAHGEVRAAFTTPLPRPSGRS
jgi:hypothetical protein